MGRRASDEVLDEDVLVDEGSFLTQKNMRRHAVAGDMNEYLLLAPRGGGVTPRTFSPG